MLSKVIVITGASSGLGKTLAIMLAENKDVKLALIARSGDKLKLVANECNATGDRVITVVADMTKRNDVRTAVKTIVDKFGRIDVMINNAGRGVWSAPSKVTAEEIMDMANVNVVSALHGMQEVLPTFIRQGQGQFINVSSLLGRAAHLAPMYGAYSAAKYMLNGMTDALRAEVAADHPVRAGCDALTARTTAGLISPLSGAPRPCRAGHHLHHRVPGRHRYGLWQGRERPGHAYTPRHAGARGRCARHHR